MKILIFVLGYITSSPFCNNAGKVIYTLYNIGEPFQSNILGQSNAGIQINQFLVIVIAIAYCKFLKQLLLLLIAIASNNYCQQYLLRNIAIFIARYCKILVTMGIIIKKYPDQVIYLGQRLRNTPLSTLRERDKFQSVFRNTDFGRIFTFFKNTLQFIHLPLGHLFGAYQVLSGVDLP